jgi:GDP-4-dehydro-6-deoxy-D-mannose reductase
LLSVSRQPKLALVTGATGFAGRHLIDALLVETGWEIVGLARRVRASPQPERCRFVVADLTVGDQVRRALTDVQPDFIFHLAAATPPVPDEQLFDMNVGGAITLLEAVTSVCPLAPVLIVGSDAQYGPQDAAHLPTAENAPMRPVAAYGRAKVLQECIALRYQRMVGLRIVCVRPFNYIGPGQSDRFVVATLARQIALAEQGLGPSTIEIGRTDTARDFTDVRDVVRAFIQSLLLGRPGAVYNIGSGTPRGIAAIAGSMASIARVRVTFHSVPSRIHQGEVRVTQCDASRLRDRTAWMPRIPIEQTLLEILDDWRTCVAASAGKA